MATLPAVGPCLDDDERRRFRRILCDTFAFTPERCQAYLELVGLTNVRVVRVGGVLAGGLTVLRKGQWFGGRPVPMAGIAVVATAVEHRARGAATALLRAVLAELHGDGVALSTLFPATLPLYRRVGYEQAGLACEVALPAGAIDVRERSLHVRPAGPGDEAAIRRVYTAWARRASGNLDRIEFNWRRAREWRGEPAQGYVVGRGAEIEGYAFLLPRATEAQRLNLRVTDLACTTPAAARRLLTLLADHRTARDQVEWRSGPADPLLAHLAEAPYTVRCPTRWMLRIVHVARALAERGYPPGVEAEVHLEVRDELLPQNAGRWVLRVAGGRGAAERGGRGALEVDVRGLAALYSGYLTAAELVLAGLARGPEAELAAAGAVFGGALPWMRDEF